MEDEPFSFKDFFKDFKGWRELATVLVIMGVIEGVWIASMMCAAHPAGMACGPILHVFTFLRYSIL
jgi:hypothetical protein